MNYLELLQEFDKAVGQDVVPYMPNSIMSRQRSRLIDEEANEALDALYAEDSEHVLKELCDVLYVVFGTASVYGWYIDEAFKRVHENNMLKVNYPRNEYGKIIKPPDHPKVKLSDLV